MTVHVSGRSIFALLLQWDDPVEKHLPRVHACGAEQGAERSRHAS